MTLLLLLVRVFAWAAMTALLAAAVFWHLVVHA